MIPRDHRGEGYREVNRFSPIYNRQRQQVRRHQKELFRADIHSINITATHKSNTDVSHRSCPAQRSHSTHARATDCDREHKLLEDAPANSAPDWRSSVAIPLREMD